MLTFENFAILVVALIVDWAVGNPNRIWNRVLHPVMLFGWLIDLGDRVFNRSGLSDSTKKLFGVIFITFFSSTAIFAGLLIADFLSGSILGAIATIVIVAMLLSQRSLYSHVTVVFDELNRNGLSSGRETVGKIVGRDPNQLDESGVIRAAIESLAENFSDGVIAPAFWFAMFGLPGLLAYKVINTADSMVGYRNEKYLSFGWATARLDDLMNLIPARLSGFLISFCAPICRGSIRDSLKVLMRDSKKHNSPNAGWPESAMAGALGISLAGPRNYSTHVADSPWINEEGRRLLISDDISRSLRVFASACAMFGCLILLVCLLRGFT